MFRENGHVRKEVEGLEDDPDAAAHAVDVDSRPGDLLAVQDDPPAVHGLEEVHAAEERRLAGPRGADQAHDLVLGEDEVDTTQDLDPAERLVEVLDDEGLAVRSRAHASLPACWRRLSRARSQSVKRAIGIVRATKMIAVAMYGV